MSGAMVRWERVSHSYGGKDVINDITLEIAAGDAVMLLGPNGAGKTTLTRMLMALVRPRVGTVTVGDWDVAGRRPDEMAARVGYAFQHADQQLFARTVREDVAFGPRRLGRGEADVDPTIDELGLTLESGMHPYELPSPMRKIVTIAGVLAMRPQVLLLDEPTAGFDKGLRARVIAAVRQRTADGVTVIAVSHDLAFVEAVGRREVTIENGKVARDVRR